MGEKDNSEYKLADCWVTMTSSGRVHLDYDHGQIKEWHENVTRALQELSWWLHRVQEDATSEADEV